MYVLLPLLVVIDVRIAETWWDKLWPLLITAILGGLVTAVIIYFLQERMERSLLDHASRLERARLADEARAAKAIEARTSVLRPLAELVPRTAQRSTGAFSDTDFDRIDQILKHEDGAYVSDVVAPVFDWRAPEREQTRRLSAAYRLLEELRRGPYGRPEHTLENMLWDFLWDEADANAPLSPEAIHADAVARGWADSLASDVVLRYAERVARDTPRETLDELRALVVQMKAHLPQVERLHGRATAALESALSSSRISYLEVVTSSRSAPPPP